MADSAFPPKDIYCHRTGFTKKCNALVTSGKCKRWMQVVGKNPNTGEDISNWDCMDNWIPIMLIENSNMQRQTGAAVESLRNEIVKRSDVASAILLERYGPIQSNGQDVLSGPETLKLIK